MKILQVNKFLYPRGGADQHMLDLSSLLTSHGDEVIPFASTHPKNLPSGFEQFFSEGKELSKAKEFGFFDTIKFGANIYYNREAKNNIAKLIDETTPDIAHLHNIYHHLSPSILPVLKQKKIPVVMTIHDYKLLSPNYNLYYRGKVHEEDANGWYLSCIKNKCINNSYSQSIFMTGAMIFHHKIKKYYETYVDLFIAPTQFVKDLFVKHGWDEKKIIVLPHFLPPSISVSTHPATPKTPARFAYIGRLSEEKGIDKLINFWIEKNIPHILDVFGSGPLEEKLIQVIQKQNAQDRIVMHGHKPRKDVMVHIKDATAVISPSLTYETFGLSAIEAFAQGVPVIAHAPGGTAEIVTAAKAGEVFTWDDSASFAQALEKIQNPAYGMSAIEYMKTHHVSEEYYGAIKNIYARLTT